MLDAWKSLTQYTSIYKESSCKYYENASISNKRFCAVIWIRSSNKNSLEFICSGAFSYLLYSLVEAQRILDASLKASPLVTFYSWFTYDFLKCTELIVKQGPFSVTR